MSAVFKNKSIRVAVIVAVIVIMLTIVGVIIYKCTAVSDLVADKAANDKLVAEANENIDTEKITLTQEQFNTLATKFYKAVKGMGTNETAVYDVFDTLQSRSDVLQLIKTFGIKDDMTLKEWLYDDMSNSEIAHINNILSSKSINYQF